MKILALEFSSGRRAVAIVDATLEGCEILADIQDSDFRGKTGLVLLGQAIEAAKLAPTDIDLIAVGLGPGSYTGIRSSIAIAQGWQLGRNTPLVGVSSAELLAHQAADSGMAQSVQIVIDAQRGELYSAVYDVSQRPPVLDRALEIVPRARIQEREGRPIVGPEAAALAPGGRDLFPSAVTLARVAFLKQQTVPGEELEPIYLRATAFVKAPPPRRI